jgi:hypothetical protein
VGRTLKPIGGVRPRPLFSADAFPTSSANAATPRIVSIIIRGPARDAIGRQRHSRISSSQCDFMSSDRARRDIDREYSGLVALLLVSA